MNALLVNVRDPLLSRRRIINGNQGWILRIGVCKQ